MSAGEPAAPHWRLLVDPGHCLALGFGSGLARVAPGTWGSVVGFGLYWPLSTLPSAYYLGLVAVLFGLGVPLCARTAAALGQHDHGAIVWDEIVGVLLTLSVCSGGIYSALLGFAAFRLFDIVKPWPIDLSDQRVQGGFGIMLDDALAAIYAGIVVLLFEYFSESYKLFQ
ncbi:MAG: phosphatidylglycerophosphatase A family protein [Gammaproteobacteria bacterium]